MSGDLTPGELADALCRSAAGDRPAMAAVDLLIAHGHWLTREVFLASVSIDRATPRYAAINWRHLAARLRTGDGLYDSTSEQDILAIACSLAGAMEINLGDRLSHLDRVNHSLVVAAVTAAGGAR